MLEFHKTSQYGQCHTVDVHYVDPSTAVSESTTWLQIHLTYYCTLHKYTPRILGYLDILIKSSYAQVFSTSQVDLRTTRYSQLLPKSYFYANIYRGLQVQSQTDKANNNFIIFDRRHFYEKAI